MIWLFLMACSGSGGQDDTEGLAPVGLRFEELAVQGNLDSATDMVMLGNDELFIASKSGEVGHYQITDDRVEELGRFTIPGVLDDLDCGLISLAIAPDFADSGQLYAGLCTSMTESGVVRVTVTSDYNAIASTSEPVYFLNEPEAANPWHNIGTLNFDDEGYLWLPFGDKTVRANGQLLSNALGSIVRIRPTESGYETHPDAPDPDLPEVWATGVRSPWRATFDANGNYWFGDVGAADFEEINVVTQAGDNFGWATHEGPCTTECDRFIDPVTQWTHDGVDQYSLDDPDVIPTPARVASVGVAYDNTDDRYEGLLDDTLLFNDFCQGFVRGMTVADDGSTSDDRHLGHLDNAVGWAQADDGFIYATTFGACESADGGRGQARLYRARLRFE
ncbi:MAG: glucose/arabinose dehydrogenase [Myxococcota bacterium]|jgi:glucose/arabinose dehydrogenase